MSENTKNRWHRRRRHDARNGDISDAFGGRAFKDIHTMVLNPCMKSPIRGGKHGPE